MTVYDFFSLAVCVHKAAWLHICVWLSVFVRAP